MDFDVLPSRLETWPDSVTGASSFLVDSVGFSIYVIGLPPNTQFNFSSNLDPFFFFLSLS